MSETFDVEVCRDGPWWLVTVPALGLVSQAADLSDVDDVALGLLGAMLKRPIDGLAVAVHVVDDHVPPVVGGHSPRDPSCRRGVVNVERLEVVSASGVWVVSSESATRYFLDLDQRLLLRQPGELSATGPYDGVWVRLLAVTNATEVGVVQVGLRHRYDLDPDPDGPGDYRWWVQRTATSIHSVRPSDRPAGRSPHPDEDRLPYTHPRADAARSGPARAEAGNDDRT